MAKDWDTGQPAIPIHGINNQVLPSAPFVASRPKRLPSPRPLQYKNAPHGLFATRKTRPTTDWPDFLEI